LEWRLWASEPLFANPTTIDVDHLGRLWVCESVNYRHSLHHKPPNRPEGDRILILEDSKGTGKADKATVFYQSPSLLAPMGIAVAKDPVGRGWKVYVCQSPDILVFEDKDGDGHADGPPKKLLTGFRGIDHDHGVHGISIGPDGKLYFSVGDQGVEKLQSSDGKGRKWTTNHTDCQAGTIWRCDQDGTNLELIAHNFRNEYKPCIDSFGNIWVSDNDDDGSQQTRICYVMPGGNYGYWPRGPGQSHWHEEQPGVVPKVLRTGFGSPTGMCVYEGTLLPKKYRGQLLHTDAGPRHVRCYRTKPKGAGYEIEREDIVTSTDNWFRPSDVCVAPDGSVFVSDWYDPGVGGHGMGDMTRGRIYRLAPKGKKYAVPVVELETKAGLAGTLNSPNLAVRWLAIAKLATMDHDTVLAVADPLKQFDDQPWAGARAAWQLAFVWPRLPFNKEIKLRVLGPTLVGNVGLMPRDDKTTALHLRVLGDYLHNPIGDIHEHKIADEKGRFKWWALDAIGPQTRSTALLTLRSQDPQASKDAIMELAKRYDGQDRFYLAAIGIAVGTDSKRREIILADFEKHFPEWNDKVADLVWELRPPSVMPTLARRLVDPKLSPAQRARVVDILAASEHTGAGLSLLKVLKTDLPAEVRDRAIENLCVFLPGKWADLIKSDEFRSIIDQLLADGDTAAAGLRLVAVAKFTAVVDRVVTLAAGGNTEAVRTLGRLPDAEAVAALDRLFREAAEKSGQGQKVIRVVESLGVQAGGGSESTEAKRALAILQRIVMAKDGPLDAKAVAVAALAGSRAGTQWLLNQHRQHKLPAELVSEAGRLLRNTPYQALRNQVLIAFPPPGRLTIARLPSPGTLALRRGDPERGKQVLNASLKGDAQCLRCHAVQGVGGNVGPDLSMIGKKASRENLYESILFPSKAIADQFVQWNITTTVGVTLSGLLIEETADRLILRDANGKDTRIERRDVAGKTKNPNSLMPNDVAQILTEDDLVNVVEYLTTLQTPALSLPRWHILGPLPNSTNDEGLDRDFGPEKAIDPDAKYRGKSGSVRWRSVNADAQGYVDLQSFHGAESPESVSYLTGTIESPADQPAKILLGSDDAAKLWVNGELVFTCRRHRPAIPGEDAVAVKLRKGRNRLLLKVANADGPHGFYLTILSVEELRTVADAIK
jgi:putative membrane-bound dehydrogenase-like protein